MLTAEDLMQAAEDCWAGRAPSVQSVALYADTAGEHYRLDLTVSSPEYEVPVKADAPNDKCPHCEARGTHTCERTAINTKHVYFDARSDSAHADRVAAAFALADAMSIRDTRDFEHARVDTHAAPRDLEWHRLMVRP